MLRSKSAAIGAMTIGSIGRLPIAQPPGIETVASPMRASIGPSTRIEARILRTMSYGASWTLNPEGSMLAVEPSNVTFAPRASRMLT